MLFKLPPRAAPTPLRSPLRDGNVTTDTLSSGAIGFEVMMEVKNIAVTNMSAVKNRLGVIRLGDGVDSACISVTEPPPSSICS